MYIYSHALASFRAPRMTLGPHLLIEDSTTEAGRILPENLAKVKFANRPLVFLNGCETVGFSPFAFAEFIESFACAGASAVVGTEATVWEAVAVDIARHFFESFVGVGKSAGEALLDARRALLAMKNPLGLAYTLYGPADLTLVRSQ